MHLLNLREDMIEALSFVPPMIITVPYKLVKISFELEPLDHRRNAIECRERMIMDINHVNVPVQPEVPVVVGFRFRITTWEMLGGGNSLV